MNTVTLNMYVSMAYPVYQAGYGIHIRVVAPQEYGFRVNPLHFGLYKIFVC